MRKIRGSVLVACSVAVILSGNQHAKANPVHSSKTPPWFLNDVKIAGTAKFPIHVANYGIELVGHTPSRLYDEWVGGSNGTTLMKNYNEAFYWHRFSMTDLYHMLTGRESGRPGRIHSIFILEQRSVGMARWVHGEAIAVGSGGFIAFADNQVITNNDHAGFDLYTVIPVHGIWVPR